ncbi:MAG TPA: response regulator [Kofleriaceae bacterium]
MSTTVLIVEDERLVAKELEIRLHKLGYAVAGIAATSDDAVGIASQHTPDLVLMDIRIRGDRDGIETAAILQRQFDVPVVFLTAHSDAATIERAKTVAPVGYLLKPLKEGELEVVLEVALNKFRMQKHLRERERWFATTLQSLGDAVITTDPHGDVTFMNPAAEQITGKTLEAVRGRPFGEALALLDESSRTAIESPIAQALRKGTIVHVSGELARKAGAPRLIADSAAPIVDDSGKVLGGVIVFRDVTERRALERQLEAAERLASLGTLAAGVAHEINNPLTWVLTTLEWASDQLAGSPTPEEMQNIIRDLRDALSGARRIQRIVADLAIFSSQKSEAKVANVGNALHQAIRELGAQVTVHLPTLPSVAIEEARLTQVFSNLLSNAMYATAKLAMGAPAITVSGRLDADTVVIEISDRGPGISPEVVPRIFEPFFTTKPVGVGSGLGLAVCHGIVGAAGGTIGVTSAPGEGTTFVLSFPRARTERPSEPPPVATEGSAKLRVLVIDDEEMMRKLLVRALNSHEVSACDATTALERFARGERFDVILCDLMMPDYTGMDVFERVSALAPEQTSRFVFVTGGAFSPRSAAFLTATTNRVLEKPFSPATVLAALEEHVAAIGPLPR